MGSKEAASLYRDILNYFYEKTLSRLPDQFQIYWLCDPSTAERSYQELFKSTGFPVKMQKGNDLGEKLCHGAGLLLNHHDQAFLVGGDCIELSPAIFKEASKQLNQHDVCVGPASDGGYYLIGIKTLMPELFQNIPWGTEKVLDATLTQASQLSLKHSLTETLNDIDLPEDWERIKQLHSKIQNTEKLFGNDKE